jgi:hypothetical protein
VTQPPPQPPPAADRSVTDRARQGDRAALESMFGQFLPPDEPIVDADYLGTYGIWWFGTHTFAAVTNRRVAALRVRKLGRITYEDALLEHVSTSSVRQPSRLLFYLLLALVLVPTVGGGIAAAVLVGPAALGLAVVGLLLLPLAIRLYRAFVKSGLLFWVREGLPVYAYCDRGRLGRANALFRAFGEQRDRFLPGDIRPPPPAVEPDSAAAAEGTLVARARAGDREAIETMFRQFLPPTDAIVASAFLGTQGFGGIGTHSFGCVTQRRVGSLRVSTFGEVLFQESLAANVNGGRIHQPSRIWLYLLVAAWVLWPFWIALGAGLAALIFLPVALLSLPFVVRAYYGRVKSGALLVVRESPPTHLFCDRGKLAAAGALYRLATERGWADSTGRAALMPLASAGRGRVLGAVAFGALLLVAGASAALVATRGGDGIGGGLFGTDETAVIGSIDFEDITIDTGSIVIETGPVETVPEDEAAPEIVAHVPPEIAASCLENVPTDDGAISQVTCDPGQGTTYIYTQFDSAAAMQAVYEARYAGYVEPDSGTGNWCEANGAAGEGPWSLDTGTAGRLACFDAQGYPWFEWTNDASAILTQAFRLDGDWAALYDAWSTFAAGPS